VYFASLAEHRVHVVVAGQVDQVRVVAAGPVVAGLLRDGGGGVQQGAGDRGGEAGAEQPGAAQQSPP
jgi:hypothetical protein